MIHTFSRESKKTLENGISSKKNAWRGPDGSIRSTGLERDYQEIGKGTTLGLLGTIGDLRSVLAATFTGHITEKQWIFFRSATSKSQIAVVGL